MRLKKMTNKDDVYKICIRICVLRVFEILRLSTHFISPFPELGNKTTIYALGIL